MCLVYAVDQKDALRRVVRFWMPYLRELLGAQTIPVVLVGNKIDTRPANFVNPDFEREMQPLMERFPEIETCVECSAKRIMNVSEVFYFAQKAVLHPMAPLFDSHAHKVGSAAERGDACSLRTRAMTAATGLRGGASTHI